MNNLEYCPDCVIELKKQSKVIGKLSIWLVCPKCGLRKRPKGWWEDKQELDEFMKTIHRDINDNIDEND